MPVVLLFYDAKVAQWRNDIAIWVHTALDEFNLLGKQVLQHKAQACERRRACL